MFKASRLLAGVALVCAGCSPEARYQRIVNHVDAPGAQLAVLEPGGGAWFGAGGDADEGEPMTTDHLLLIGSNTKVWTAAAVLSLVDEEVLQLDDSASTWVPALDTEITLRDLLQHTSGLGEYFEHDKMEGHIGDAWAPADLIRLGQEVRDDGPGATATYANTNYIALGLVLEAVTGQPYAAVIQDRVLDPLGLTRSGIYDRDAPPEGLAMGDGGAYDSVTSADPSVGWAAGSGYATAEELALMYEGILSGALYSDALVQQQREGVSADLGFDDPSLETAYGLGLMIVGVGDQLVIGHLGSVEGFSSMGLRDEETGAFAATLSNTSEVVVPDPTLKALRIAGRQ